MWRNNTAMLTDNRFNIVLIHGALGDVICSLPAIVHARQTQPSALKIKVWTPGWQKELLAHLLAPYGEFEIADFAEFPMKKVERQELDLGPVAINQFPYNTHTRARVHMVDYAFGCLLDAKPENMVERSYPTMAPLGPRPNISGRYVVFPVGATSDNKLFRASVMGPIMQWTFDNGYLPVIVGTKTSYVQAETATGPEPLVLRDEVDKLPPELLACCLDLREKTTLLQLRDVLGYAEAVVGVDGGTIHLAGTTKTNIVYGLTTTLPKHRYVPRIGDPNYKIRYVGPRDLACAGCQSNMTLLFHHDFRFCVYKDNLCTDKLHPEDFINGLKQLGL